MEWGINDNLKTRSYGQKHDYDDKIDRFTENVKDYKQYYPGGADGNINEWEALIRQQQEIVKQEEQEQKEHEKEQK